MQVAYVACRNWPIDEKGDTELLVGLEVPTGGGGVFIS